MKVNCNDILLRIAFKILGLVVRIEKHISKGLEENRLDEYLMAIIRAITWDDLMLAFANVCVFKANGNNIKQDSKEYRAWIDRGWHFHDAIVNKKTATVQKRKFKKEIENANKPTEE